MRDYTKMNTNQRSEKTGNCNFLIEKLAVRKTNGQNEIGQTAGITGLLQPPPNVCGANHNALCRKQTLNVVTNSNARGASRMEGSNIQLVWQTNN